MILDDAVRGRRSVKRFTEREVTRDEIEALLSAAVTAPNHRLTEPWRFYVLGPAARRGYGTALGRRKAKKAPDEKAAAEIVERVAALHEGLPAMLAVAVVLSDDPEIREEDYAATWMAIQNLGLVAVARGLGSHIKTGAVMDDPAARAAVGLPDGERIVASIHIGEPAELPPERPRTDPASLTTWVP